MSGNDGDGYAGDVGARAAWDALVADPAAVLIDVRTRAEWAYVGTPTLGEIGKDVLLVAWDDFPTGPIPDFAGRLAAVLEGKGIGKDAPLYFLCRSGARSRNAAIAATATGHAPCFNIEFGFEGLLGPDRHRATAGSWKAEGLPWIQS
jgi:rhodanese-related sulfurtransferase